MANRIKCQRQKRVDRDQEVSIGCNNLVKNDFGESRISGIPRSEMGCLQGLSSRKMAEFGEERKKLN